MRPLLLKELEVFVDASFCGDWCADEAARDREVSTRIHFQLRRLFLTLEIAMTDGDRTLVYRE